LSGFKKGGAGCIGWVAFGLGKAQFYEFIIDKGILYKDVTEQAVVTIGFGVIPIEGDFLSENEVAVLGG